MVGWYFDCLVGWLIGCVVGWLDRWMFGCLVGRSSIRKHNPRSLGRWNRIPIVILTARCFGKSRRTKAASHGSLTVLSGVRKAQTGTVIQLF